MVEYRINCLASARKKMVNYGVVAYARSVDAINWDYHAIASKYPAIRMLST